MVRNVHSTGQVEEIRVLVKFIEDWTRTVLELGCGEYGDAILRKFRSEV